MPHIVVEYSDTLQIDVSKLTSALHETMVDMPTVNAETIRTRAMPVQNAVIGLKDKADTMIHITLKLLPGRDDALRKTMAQALFEVAYRMRPDEKTIVTAETTELHEPSYCIYSQARRSSDA